MALLLGWGLTKGLTIALDEFSKASMDKFILQSFLALRTDYKTGKLASVLKA